MATSITTQADVLTYLTITDNEINRVSTERMEADNWAGVHGEAWSLVKSYLYDRKPRVEESDLDDPTELEYTTCCCVMYLAYQQAQLLSDEDAKRKQYWFKKFRKALAQVVITSDSTELSQESYSGRRSLRA